MERNLVTARRYFEQGRDLGDPESMYNYAMLRLGWMVTELKDLPPSSNQRVHDIESTSKTPASRAYITYRADTSEGSTTADRANAKKNYKGPSASDHKVAIQDLTRAATKGHLQSKVSRFSFCGVNEHRRFSPRLFHLRSTSSGCSMPPVPSCLQRTANPPRR